MTAACVSFQPKLLPGASSRRLSRENISYILWLPLDGRIDDNRARPHRSKPASSRQSGRARRHVWPHARGRTARGISAVLRPRRRLSSLGRRRPQISRLHVQLGTCRARPSPSRGRCRGAPADGAGRLPERSDRTHGRTGRAPGRPGDACRLGAVFQERHRRDHDLRDAGARRHRQAQGAAGQRRLSWCGSLVLAVSVRRDVRGSCAHPLFRLQ